MSDLAADMDQLQQFVDALFCHADSGTYVNLRSFDQFRRGVPAQLIRSVQVNGSLDHVIAEATTAATESTSGDHRWVFAPPVCTFTTNRTRAEDLANGLTLSVEVDEHVGRARQKLEFLLGPATIIVASGSDWINPDTGEVEPKLHLHWRLSEPTRDPEDHARLLHCRHMATHLVGADPTGKPIVHPLRWPGSWNVKTTPRMARIVARTDHEIHLVEAVDLLESAIDQAGLQSVGRPISSSPGDPSGIYAAAMAAIPNPDLHYDDWIRYGYACYRASGGSADGYDAWDAWSRKSSKYDAAQQEAAWKRIGNAIADSSAPRTIGAGTIFYFAKLHGWQRPTPEPPPDINDPGYYSAQEEWAQEPHAAGEDTPRTFPASPLDWDAMEAVPRRKWVYGHILIRRFISVLGAPGGTGKTAYAVAVALAIVTGRDLLGETIHEPGNVWLYNLEDPKEELHRRIHATVLHYGISRVEVEGRLFLDAGRDRPLVVAYSTKDGTVIRAPIVPLVIEELRQRNVKVLIVDPFVRSHQLTENDNNQMDYAAALWGEVAEKADCAIWLVHHFRKGGVSGTADAFRGGSALIDAARAAVSLATMSEQDADSLGVEAAERRLMIRLDNAKLNLAPPPAETTWLKLVSVELPNGNPDRDERGDFIQTVERWSPQSPWDGLSIATCVHILERLKEGTETGEQFTVSGRGPTGARWAGNIIAEMGNKTPGQAAQILKEWVKTGLVKATVYVSKNTRKSVGGLEVNEETFQKMRHTAYAPPREDDE